MAGAELTDEQTYCAEMPSVVADATLSAVTRGARSRWWVRCGSKRRGFRYETTDGRPVVDAEALERIRALAIPPAWAEVRIAPSARSPLQAIGVDKSGRVQRVYHLSSAARRQRLKYEKIVRFGEALPNLRRKANEDIAREGLGRERVLAVVIRLINDLYFRLGSEESVKRYRTFGVTTFRNRHLEIKPGGQLIFSFVGKHHIRHRRIVVDEELAALMHDLKAIGGAKLFEYYDDEGKVRAVKPRDVNDYIKAAAGAEFSAKDFRTWGGTLLAAISLAEAGRADDEQQAKRHVASAVKRVAERLGNTPNVCRECYVHPKILDSYLRRGVTLEEFRPRRERRRIHKQQPEYEIEELVLLKLLKGQKDEDENA